MSNDRSRSSRRTFLKAVGALGVGAAGVGPTLWLPKSARAAGPSGLVKRVILVSCGGGIDWGATFDAVPSNPWGIAPWAKLGASGAAPQWGFSRMLMQKPASETTTDWSPIPAYLQSDTFNTQRSVLASWGGAALPTFADVAKETAVVRVSNNPGGGANLDHALASSFLRTNSFSGGDAGIATAFYDALKRQLGANADTFYTMPAVAYGAGAPFGTGVGVFAGSRPMTLQTATQLPASDPTASVARWGFAAERALNERFVVGRPTYSAQSVGNLIADDDSASRYGASLLNPALRIGTAPSAALGKRPGTTTPVTNAMLREAFAINSAETPANDILFDGKAAHGVTSWTNDVLGYNAAFAVRMLQMGSPFVAMGPDDGAFDHHSGMVAGYSLGGHPYHIVRVARTLAALSFALKNVVDPQDPTRSLWDSTVVFVCSEFGRPNAFNSPNGAANGGGTDHAGESAFVVLGGPVAASGAGGKLVVDTANGGYFHQTRFYTTLLAGMGVEAKNSPYLRFEDHAPISGLFTGG